MSKKINKKEFIERSTDIHGEKYNYSKVEYINNHTKVCIICPEHGEFWQNPKNHMRGEGCPKCAALIRNNKRFNKDIFLEKCNIKYGNYFDYSLVEYKTCYDNIKIICPEHGVFEITPIKHLQNKYGCPHCFNNERGKSKRDNSNIFIKKSIIIHGDKYDYSHVNYVNNKTIVDIICPKHGIFQVTPHNHIHCKSGCEKCSFETKNNFKESKKKIREKIKNELKETKQNNFINKSNEIHNNKYDYSKVEYINNHTKVCIICPEHGEFWQLPSNHIRGCQCPLCAKDIIKIKNSDTKQDFIEKAIKVHGNKYDYSKVEYINNHTKVCIICPEHGEFWQTPGMHTSEQQGCPNCGTLSSKGELEILKYLQDNINDTIINRDKSIIGNRKEIDIWVPNYNIAIEYHGLRWHSELFNDDKYSHLNKTNICNSKNIRLLQIFEDEWLYKQDIVKEKLKHIFSLNGNKEKIYARKCEIKVIDSSIASNFMEHFHIQGSSRASIHIGALYKDKLIGVMGFIKCDNNKNEWELNRFATDYNYVCCGIGGKIFKYFIKNYNPSLIKSFADKRWSLGDLYEKLGFILEYEVPPQYQYVTPHNSYKIRYHKFNFRKKILLKKYPDLLNENMTEHEMTKILGYYRIYDCGLIKYVWKKDFENIK